MSSSPPRARGAVRSLATLALSATLLSAAYATSLSTLREGSTPAPPDPAASEVDPHAAIFQESEYPSAKRCAACHEQIFEEWASSNHAYAAISPMFHKFEQKINELAQGTIGTFCVRCHIPVGTALGEERETPLWERDPTSVEGITCIACHRVKEDYGRVNGERRIEPGSIFEPIYGSTGSPALDELIESTDVVATAPGEEGDPIHTDAIRHDQIDQSAFCTSCHQVAVHPGIKLEIVVDQYRASPAQERGISCQDCHMGKVQGVWLGSDEENYETAPAAIVPGASPLEPRKHADHGFVGPGYSIAHPGFFPHQSYDTGISIREWMLFDWRERWGSPEFEERARAGEVSEDHFPPEWRDPDERADAWDLVEANLAKLDERQRQRQAVMNRGSELHGPFWDDPPRVGEDFHFEFLVKNVNSGHNLPSGSLGAQPEVWLNVSLIDPDGDIAWESGYVDSNGDMADWHSLDVAAGEIEYDSQLWNLQTKFLTTNVKGTDREMYLPVNLDFDQLPFIRPANVPTTVLNHPPFVRMENHSLPPLSDRPAKYEVPGDVITEPGTWRIAARLRSRAEPIYFMKFVGATQEMINRMNERMIDIHPMVVEFEVR